MIKNWTKYRVSKNDADDVVSWLKANVGRYASSKQDVTADWIWFHASRPDPYEEEFLVGIRDSNKAMLFKLRWGGV